uniref:Testis-specific Y-encoded-like protein 1 n=1 Tax=Bos mutus grunniens TaxID=30521 RepID=A0A8B9XB00_BOSMU
MSLIIKTPLLETHSLATSDCAAGAPDPSRCLKTEASQVMAETGEGYFEAVTLPPPQLPEEEDAPPAAPPDPGCASTFQIRAGGDGGYVAPEARLEPAPPTEGLEMASGSLATDDSLGNGRQPGEPLGLSQEKPLETCGAENLGSDLMAEAKAEEVKTEDGPVFSVAVDEEVVGKEGNRVVEEAGHRPLRMDLHMNPLEADRAFQQLEHKFGWMRRHYLERRNYIIQNIPGFWVTAFRNLPQLSPMIRGQDAEMLRYITNLEVKELRHPRTGCKFKFFFRRNPYFRNQLIVKEYEVRASGRVVSLSTPIIWRRGHEPQSFIRRNQEVVCNFFTWFSDHSLPESDRIAEIIKEDLWPDPLQYYLLREGVRRARRRPVREPVEIPRPFGFQSG